MPFIRTFAIIAALLLGWFALRAESAARSNDAPRPAVEQTSPK